MTEQEKQEIKKLWEQGMPATQIARLLPYKNYVTIRAITELKKTGFLRPRKVSEIRDKTIVQEFQRNRNLRKIADKYGIGLRYVQQILLRNGIHHKKTMNYTEPNKKRRLIEKDLINKLPQTQIAKKHGVSRQYVWQIKERLDEKSN